MSGGSVLNVIRCKDTRRIAASALDQGWEWIGYTRAGHVEFRWPATDTRLHCATTPSDRNAWKAFARNIKQVSGVETWEKSNHRRPRKKADKSAEVQLEASRRRHQGKVARLEAARSAAEAAQRRRELAADRAADDDQHRREIESLMRPGYGR